YWKPDVCADLADKNLIGTTHQTDRFGEVEIQREMFDEIICNDVIEHIPDLVSAMTNCLNLLKVGGKFNILVPYDLSYGAWQDPTH
ncbi:methyltransferase domain-containing protein, partial [Idiomarina sp. Sol25]